MGVVTKFRIFREGKVRGGSQVDVPRHARGAPFRETGSTDDDSANIPRGSGLRDPQESWGNLLIPPYVSMSIGSFEYFSSGIP